MELLDETSESDIGIERSPSDISNKSSKSSYEYGRNYILRYRYVK